MGTIDNLTTKTFHIAAELAASFDAVRPIFGMTDQASSHAMRSVAALVPWRVMRSST
jgi:hypothetical protein